VKSQHAFLTDIPALVTATGIPYMITGSLASTYYGRPRTTQDIDLIVQPNASQLDAFVESARLRGYYVDAGYKLDLIMQKDREFSRQEFRRRREVTLLGTRAFMVSAEDSILSKLEWSRGGTSERQFLDALAVARTQGDSLDGACLAQWAAELGLESELDRLLAEMRRLSTS
jgi:hypothetical protein